MTPQIPPLGSATVLAYRPSRPRGLCRGIVFALPEAGPFSLSPTGTTANNWLAELGCPHRPREPIEADDILAAMLDDHAGRLKLPAAAVITDQIAPEDERCSELLSVLTVLAKSSGRVYLRSKEPNLANLNWGRRAVVLVPR